MDQPKYHIDIFWSDEDVGYIANVPDLRYCSAFGESYEEALREVLEAMELHLDTLRELGRPVPEPESRRGVGVSALVLESGQTVELQEESGGLIGFAGAEKIPSKAEVIVEDVAQRAGQAVQDTGEATGQAVQDVSEATGQATQDVSEATGQATQDVGEGARQLGGYALEYDEDESAEDEESQSARRSGRRSTQ